MTSQTYSQQRPRAEPRQLFPPRSQNRSPDYENTRYRPQGLDYENTRSPSRPAPRPRIPRLVTPSRLPSVPHLLVTPPRHTAESSQQPLSWPEVSPPDKQDETMQSTSKSKLTLPQSLKKLMTINPNFIHDKSPFKNENELKPKWTSTPFKRWDGTPWDSPSWARKGQSIQEITEHQSLLAPDETKPRIDKPCHKSFDLNGVNFKTVFDIKILSDRDPITIAMRELSSFRHNRKEVKRTMYIPCEFWFNITNIMLKIQTTRLPAAVSDYTQEAEELLYQTTWATKAPNGTWTGCIAIQIEKDLHGTERMLKITCSDQISTSKQEIRFPWIHIPIFNIHANRISKELYQTSEGKYGIPEYKEEVSPQNTKTVKTKKF